MNKKLVDTNLTISKRGRAENYWLNQQVQTKNAKPEMANDNVDLPEILQAYKLRGFEFGNWLSNNDRYDHVLACQSALADLAKVMHTANIGFDSIIGIAFGARGMSRALAHYEPGLNMINLTKEKGAGSLAHEYGHALDWNLGRLVDQHAHYNWLTGGRSTRSTIEDNKGGQFRHYTNAIVDKIKASESYKRIADSSEYWLRRNEIFARAFEQYVCYCLKNRGDNNRYLTKSWTYYTTQSVYLTEKDFSQIRTLFDKLVREISLYTQNKCKVIAIPYPSENIKKAAAKPAPTIKKEAMPKAVKKSAPKEKKHVLNKKITQAKAFKFLIPLSSKKGKEMIAMDKTVYYTPQGAMVATNGFIMGVVYQGVFAETPIKDKIVHKDGHEVNGKGKYPNWSGVIPNPDKFKQTVVLNIDDELKRAAEIAKRNKHDLETNSVRLGERAFSCAHYTLTLRFMRNFGKTCSFKENKDKTRPSMFSNGSVLCLIMPIFDETDTTTN